MTDEIPEEVVAPWCESVYVTTVTTDGHKYTSRYSIPLDVLDRYRGNPEDLKRAQEMVTVNQCVNKVYQDGKSLVSLEVKWRREQL